MCAHGNQTATVHRTDMLNIVGDRAKELFECQWNEIYEISQFDSNVC